MVSIQVVKHNKEMESIFKKKPNGMLKPKSTISEMKNLLSIWNLQKKGSVN